MKHCTIKKHSCLSHHDKLLHDGREARLSLFGWKDVVNELIRAAINAAICSAYNLSTNGFVQTRDLLCREEDMQSQGGPRGVSNLANLDSRNPRQRVVTEQFQRNEASWMFC